MKHTAGSVCGCSCKRILTKVDRVIIESCCVAAAGTARGGGWMKDDCTAVGSSVEERVCCSVCGCVLVSAHVKKAC